MKMELNLPALERLIGGDSEIELKLRRQIVKVFEDHHLKQLATNMMQPQVIAVITEKVNATVKEELDIPRMADDLWPTISAKLRELIWGEVRTQVRAAVESVTAEFITQQRTQLMSTLLSQLQAELTRSLRTEVQAIVKSAMTAGTNAAMLHAEVASEPPAERATPTRSVLIDGAGFQR